jgi:GNAT superfamily N-acetyltransferase
VAEDLIIEPIDERPELADLLWQLDDAWPAFVVADPISNLYFVRAPHDHPAHALVAYEASAPGVAVARAFSVPFAFGGPGRTVLPTDGWDAVVRWAALDRMADRTPNLVSALDITVHPDRQGEGLAARMLDALRRNARRLGFDELVAPVRPAGKPTEPDTPMTEYAHRTRDDGLPSDPWLRVHVRAGGEIVGVCPRAMVVPGTLAEWRDWTGLPFDRTGDVLVPGALVPVHCSVEHDHAVYVEPGVWVRHRLA